MLLAGFAVGAWYGGNKGQALWYGFFGVVCLLLLITLQLQEAIRHDEPPSQKAGEAATIQARAYVSVNDAGLSDLIGDTPPTVFVSIKNTGQTPAYDLTWRAFFTLRDFPVSGEFLLDRQKDAPKSILPPGQSLFYQWTFTDWKKEFASRISKGQAAIFAVGEISYKDAFGNVRSTKYRLIHGGDTMVAPGKFGPAAEGNEAD